MATTYYMRVHIESQGTSYTDDKGNTSPSKAGHMWYEIYQKDGNGNVIAGSKLGAGYTGSGVVNTDAENYTGNPAYSSKEFCFFAPFMVFLFIFNHTN